MRKRTIVLCLLALGVVWIAVSAQVGKGVTTGETTLATEQQTELQEDTECALESSIDAPGDEAPLIEASRPPCKSCKGREWCGCTYNGKPRVSCNPCCYRGATDPLPVCFD